MRIFIKKLLQILIVTFFMSVSYPGYAIDDNISIKVLTPSAIRTIIGPYPTSGSSEESLDYETLLEWQNSRTIDECELADLQNNANISSFYVSNHGPLTNAEAKILEKKFFKHYAEIGLNILLAKKLFKRPRPYIANSEIIPCIELESSSSYPSGHATMAHALALLISTVYPERTIELLKRAEQASLNRVIGGVHHPSDIIAGEKLGNAVFKLIK